MGYSHCFKLLDVDRRGATRTDLDVTFNQDYMCWITQGAIAKRNLEKLGESDRGVILFRKMLLEQVKLVNSGMEPTLNIFRDPAENEGLEHPVIPNEAGEWVGAPRGGNFSYHPQEVGYSRDADKIEAVMATWKDRVDELLT